MLFIDVITHMTGRSLLAGVAFTSRDSNALEEVYVSAIVQLIDFCMKIIIEYINQNIRFSKMYRCANPSEYWNPYSIRAP